MVEKLAGIVGALEPPRLKGVLTAISLILCCSTSAYIGLLEKIDEGDKANRQELSKLKENMGAVEKSSDRNSALLESNFKLLEMIRQDVREIRERAK
jgi:hypothetical protein